MDMIYTYKNETTVERKEMSTGGEAVKMEGKGKNDHGKKEEMNEYKI